MMVGEIKRVEDMNYFELLAWLGIGSSHPGGFSATKQNLAALQVKPEEYVLDAGCGSGLTACHLAKTVGCKIIGVDLNPQMIEKANLRAKRENVPNLVEFRVADVCDLPYADNHFDLVIAESISVFLDKAKVYREFYRVLKPEGRVADLEMALQQELPVKIKLQMKECFGQSTEPLPFEKWLHVLKQAGFEDVQIKNAQPLKNSRNNLIVNELKRDWLLVKDLTDKAMNQPSLLPRLQKNAGFMKRNQGYFGFGLIYGRKPTPPPRKLGLNDRLRQWLRSFLGSYPQKILPLGRFKQNQNKKILEAKAQNLVKFKFVDKKIMSFYSISP